MYMSFISRVLKSTLVYTSKADTFQFLHLLKCKVAIANCVKLKKLPGKRFNF